jgi:sec-independent protein translocase protein TatA
MGAFGPLHWLLLIAVIVLLFGGRGKISELMGDFAQGIRSFRKGLADDEQKTTISPPDRRDDPASVKKDTPAHS